MLINKAAVRARLEAMIVARAEHLKARGLPYQDELRISGEVVDGAQVAATRAVDKFINEGFERGKFQRRGKTLFVRG